MAVIVMRIMMVAIVIRPQNSTGVKRRANINHSTKKYANASFSECEQAIYYTFFNCFGLSFVALSI